MTDNHAHEGGGAIFYVSNDRTGTLAIRWSTLRRNPSDGFETQPGHLLPRASTVGRTPSCAEPGGDSAGLVVGRRQGSTRLIAAAARSPVSRAAAWSDRPVTPAPSRAPGTPRIRRQDDYRTDN